MDHNHILEIDVLDNTEILHIKLFPVFVDLDRCYASTEAVFCKLPRWVEMGSSFLSWVVIYA
jgi:hypothetical protein